MDNQRKQFIKERKKYEKLLKTKAKLGILSLPEKEQYQSMRYSKRRNRLIKKEKLLGAIATIGISVTMLIIFYVRPDIFEVNNKVPEKITTQKNVEQAQPVFSYKKEIVEKVEAYIQLNSKANEYFNEGIAEYNQDHRIGINHIENLTSLYRVEATTGFNTLRDLLNYKLDKQIDILNRLERADEKKEQIRKEIEEIRKVDELYKEIIYEILEREDIEYIKN